MSEQTVDLSIDDYARPRVTKPSAKLPFPYNVPVDKPTIEAWTPAPIIPVQS